MISIHASAKEATWCPPFFWPLVHFNPRLREGGDVRHNLLYLVIKISIHASAKEATIDTDGSKRYYWGFQSTPPRRRRRFYRLHTNIFAGIFQSTPPRRRRLAQPRMIRVRNLISIHASAKEAT